jgi:hypothetical protein
VVIPLFIQNSLFFGPYEESVSCALSDEEDARSDKFSPETELEEVLENAPGRWRNSVKSFHTHFHEMDQTISSSTLCNKLRDTEYCRSVLATVPPVGIKQLQRILRGVAECTSSSLIQAFVGHAEDQFWLSPDNPGWSLQVLKNLGLLFPTSFTESDAELFVPADIKETVENVMENPPDSTHKFPVPKEERVRLRLPEKSYFRDLTEQIEGIRKRLLSGQSFQFDEDVFTHILNDPFKMLLLFVGIIGDDDTDFRTLKKPMKKFIEKLVSRQDCSDLADLLTQLMFTNIGEVRFIVGKDPSDKLYVKLWDGLVKNHFESESVSSSFFSLGNFSAIWLNTDYLHSLRQRFSLVVPLILYTCQEPLERALEWIHEQDESHYVANESLPSGILRWVEHGPHDLDRDQSLTLLHEAIDHRRSGIRRKAYRILRDRYIDEFRDLLPEARDDESKKVREWAKNQDQQQLL